MITLLRLCRTAVLALAGPALFLTASLASEPPELGQPSRAPSSQSSHPPVSKPQITNPKASAPQAKPQQSSPVRQGAVPEITSAPTLPPPNQSQKITLDRLNTELTFYVVERPLDAVLTEVARLAGLRLRTNDRIEEIVITNRRLSGTASAILDDLTRQNNLVWFAERDLVDVSKADTATVKTFQITGLKEAQIRDAVQRYGLVNVDQALEVDEGNNVLRVFGPPRLVSRLESVVTGLKPGSQAQNEPIEIIRFGFREGQGPSKP